MEYTVSQSLTVRDPSGDVYGRTSTAKGTTPWMGEVGQRREQLPRIPGAVNEVGLCVDNAAVDWHQQHDWMESQVFPLQL